jgi:hypothetical protein
MSQQTLDGNKTFVSDAAIGKWLRVKGSGTAGQVSVAGDEIALGHSQNETFAANEDCTVRLDTAEGTRKAVAAGSFNAHVALYGAANGKVDDSGSYYIGTSLEASGGDGEVIEYLPGGYDADPAS